MRLLTVALQFLLAALLLGSARPALGHAVQDDTAAPALEWTFEPWVVACLALSLLFYASGAVRLWKRTKNAKGAFARQIGCFFSGWLALVVALVSPLDALSNQLFSAHMVQHELLMIIAAPLLVLGRPFGVWVWAMPTAARQAVAKTSRLSFVRRPWRAITHPGSAWILQAAALWLWHIPPLFQAALTDNDIHALQHASFLVSALLFWWSVVGIHGRPQGASILYLFTTMMHTGALGALLTMSGRLWYPAYAGTAGIFGLEPIEDQQLGGLIMWVPGGMAYVLAGLALCSRWLDERRGADRTPAVITGAAKI